MKTYGEYCPIAMGAEAIGDRWTILVLRELICGSTRFSDIHRGVPRMSRTLLSQRLRQLCRTGIVDHADGEYRLTETGRDLEDVIWALGDWSVQWFGADPSKEHYDGAHLMWRVRQRLAVDALPERRTVLQFDFPQATRGRHVWLVLDGERSSVCERDEGFEVDLFVTADIGEFLRVWAGRSTWRDAIADGKISLDGPRRLVAAFPKWFLLSPFVQRGSAVATRR